MTPCYHARAEYAHIDGEPCLCYCGRTRISGQQLQEGKSSVSSHKVVKSIAEINERIRKGQAVVLNAEEMVEAVRRLGAEQAAKEVDVVTTGTFSPMCSSGLLFNTGSRNRPRSGRRSLAQRRSRLWPDLPPCSYLGATELPDDDPQNKVYPGQFRYGGGHVIEDLVSGKAVPLACCGLWYGLLSAQDAGPLGDVERSAVCTAAESTECYQISMRR